MTVSEEFKKLVSEKYREMKTVDRDEDFLDENLLGGIKVMINNKPKYCLLTLHFENNDTVYVGSNEL